MTGFPVTMPVLTLLVTVAGCAGPIGTIRPGVAVAPPPTTFDGSYRTTIRIAGGSAAAQGQNWCQTPSQSVLTVTQGEFSYSVAHPNAPGEPTAVFQAAMAADGTFAGQGVGGSVSGHVSGSRIEGRIDGQGCIYDFAGNRT
jgi:hypothetical protein